MLDKLDPYIGPIIQVCFLFPVLAALFTLPFLIRNYRKYGGIALMRVLVVYSFIFYEMCAFFLTVLPLPSLESVAAAAPVRPCFVPFTDLMTGLQHHGISFSSPVTLLRVSNWLEFFSSSDFFQILANIVMQIPLGFYLRYYFRRSWKQTLLIGMCVSLFYELTQFTGLWFIYPHAYRFATVDDVITNTLGCMAGFWLTPLLSWFLPTRDEIDRISYARGEHITLLRRALATILDLAVFLLLSKGSAAFLLRLSGGKVVIPVSAGRIVWFVIYFALVPWLTKGKTLGKAVFSLKIAGEDGKRAKFWQLLLRYVLLICVEPMLLLGAVIMLIFVMLTIYLHGGTFGIRMLIIAGELLVLAFCIGFPLRCQKRWNKFPHGHYSHTKVVHTGGRQQLPQ